MMAQLLNDEALSKVAGGNEGPGIAPFIIYTVKAGDTLSGIAMKYKTTVAKLMELNEIANPNWINIGQEIMIPNPDYITE